MMDFYFLPFMQIGLFFIASLICFAVQSVYIARRVFNYDIKRHKSFFSELLLLIYIAILAFVPACVYGYRPHGVVAIETVENALLIFGFITVLALALLPTEVKWQRLSAICFLFITQPALANAIGISYHVLWLIGIMLLALRAYFINCQEGARQKDRLSTASIQQALENLPAGIMFCGADGYIYLVNRKMQSLMLKFLGAELKNGAILWDKLSSGEVQLAGCQTIQGDILIHNEHEAWRFARRTFHAKNTDFVEITAIDATESYAVLHKLEQERDALAEETALTEKLAETMEAVQKEREYLRIRSQVHDVLSQQLTAMQRLSQSGDITQFRELLAHSHEAIEGIKEHNQKNAALFFAEIVEYFGKIGLEVRLTPELPDESAVAFLLLTALREACSNAIRHAGASLVSVTVEHGAEGYRIEIKNNGALPKKGLVEGGGLFGIRARVEDAGGTMKVEVIPEFSIVISVSAAQINKA